MDKSRYCYILRHIFMLFLPRLFIPHSLIFVLKYVAFLFYWQYISFTSRIVESSSVCSTYHWVLLSRWSVLETKAYFSRIDVCWLPKIKDLICFLFEEEGPSDFLIVYNRIRLNYLFLSWIFFINIYRGLLLFNTLPFTSFIW